MYFYRCKKCGSIIMQDTPLNCCGEEREEMVPNTTDAAGEKHVPVLKVQGSQVQVSVGEVEHPMLEAHYIAWVVLETSMGFQKKRLAPGDKPVASFVLAEGETPVAAYELCNLHGLWSAKA